MKLPNRYGYGTLFAFSGLDGVNSHKEDFVGMTMKEPVSIRFDAPQPITLRVPVSGFEMDYLLSDALCCKELLLVVADAQTVLGKTTKTPEIFAEPAVSPQDLGGASVLDCGTYSYALFCQNGRFAFCRAETPQAAADAAKEKTALDIDAIAQAKLEYYRALPPCPMEPFEKLYYKCLSVNKVNVYSPQDGISCRFTTPDRLPHRHMWLWDSMFHAACMAHYNIELAKDAIRAVLQCQHEDGFIPHMMKSKTEHSAITQPQVIAWAVLRVFEKSGDKAFLAECADPIARWLLWFLQNRDLNQNGLLEWQTDYSNVRCRCDESGMDNSPRFDTTERLDAIDCSSFMVSDCRSLAKIYRLLGNEAEAARFQKIGDGMAERINALLWDEEGGYYCDRTQSGKLTGVLTVCSFLPLFAGVCSEKQAERLAKLLQDETKFATPLSIPSIARDHPDYGADMWRGCVWLNFNYLIAEGLRRYGFDSLAKTMTEKTLLTVNRWFQETGAVFEFYDAEDQTAPWHLNRKGPQPDEPDYRIRYHAITDFNWSACFTLLMIWDAADRS